MTRRKPTRPTKRQRADALAALHGTVTDDSVPPYAKVRAAAALLGADRPESADAFVERDPDAPRKYIVLPDNGRNPNVRYGLYSEEQLTVVVPAGFPMEVMPESHYRDVAKPVDRLARKRPMLPAAELEGDEQ
jgi:hypothetical protein